MDSQMLNVIIVGAGIAGLTCGISLARYGVTVTILERAPAIAPAGNGIQVPGNACHALRSLDLLDTLIAKAGGVAPGCLSVDYQDGRVLLERDFMRHEKAYGAPWLLVHRADYVDVLLQEAYRLGIDIQLGCEVRDIDFDAPSVSLPNGDVYTGDVIIGCDGINSTIRRALHPQIQPSLTGTFAYRALFTPQDLSSPLFDTIRTSPSCRFWLGPKGHVVFYPLRGGQVFNLVLIIADGAFNAECSANGDVRQLIRDWLCHWDPVVKGLVEVAGGLVMFPLWEVEELRGWSRGCVAIMGDAAHPTLPYLGQGAAMAVEDALVLGTLLGLLNRHASNTSSPPSRAQTNSLLRAYECLQRPRTSTIVARSRENGEFNHLPRGPEQQARDAVFADFDMLTTSSQCAWVDADFNRELLARDAKAVAVAEFDRLVKDGLLRQVRVEDSSGGTRVERSENIVLQARL